MKHGVSLLPSSDWQTSLLPKSPNSRSWWMISGEKTGKWRRVLQVVRSMQTATSSLPELAPLAIGHKDHKVTKSEGPRGSTAQVEAAQRNFQALKETLNILASVLPLFLNLFNCWSASAFSLPELRSQSNCLQCGDRSLWKRSYPCVFRWPQPQSISSCSLNVGFHEFHLLL